MYFLLSFLLLLFCCCFFFCWSAGLHVNGKASRYVPSLSAHLRTSCLVQQLASVVQYFHQFLQSCLVPQLCRNIIQSVWQLACIVQNSPLLPVVLFLSLNRASVLQLASVVQYLRLLPAISCPLALQDCRTSAVKITSSLFLCTIMTYVYFRHGCSGWVTCVQAVTS